jgi:hypothetical protein
MDGQATHRRRRMRRLLLLALVLFLLSTAGPGTAGTNDRPRDPQLRDDGPPALSAT